MGTASLAASINANERLPRSSKSISTNVRASKITAEIIRVCRNAMTGGSFRKTMAARAKCSMGTVDNWTASNRVIDLEHFLNVCAGPEGLECIDALWAHIPEETRERWLTRQILERRLAEAEAEVKRVRREADERQIHMELSRR